jgi:branched-chain amino acid transport system substrate-binding protein
VAGIRGTAPAAAPAGIDSPFQSAFAATNVEPLFSAHTYDCTILAALAAVKARSSEPAKLAKAFTANLRGKQDCDTFAACQALLASGTSIHWRGASSRFDRFGEFQPDEGVYDVWSYDGTGAVVTDPPSSQITIR